MKKIFFAAFIICSQPLTAQNLVNIIPMPADVKPGKGTFTLSSQTLIVAEGSGMEKTISFFNNYLRKTFGYALRQVKQTSSANVIRFNYERMDNPLPGAYTLTADKNGIYIAGDNEEGIFYGMQTLIQLMPPDTDLGVKKTAIHFTIPYVTIHDRPRFAYRGMHLDVCRHFFPVEYVKRYIDFLAAYKYNTFHWHLTDDQGWRIEIKKYPLLTQVGGCRDRTLIGRYGSNKYDSIRHCGYFTQDQVKEIVKYAADRYITVIPEIEMPGHSTAALASYPYLGCTKGPYKVMDTWGVLDDVYCAGNDSTYKFIEEVLEEVIALFPSKYIHIGGDECPKERWKTCPVCQKKIKDEGLKDEHALQSYFVQRIEKFVNSKGRSIIGWDEILEGGLAPNATVMSWRGEEGGITAAKQDHDVIMTPGSHCYLDHSQSKNEDSLTIGGYLPLEKVYSYEPIPAALDEKQARHVLGAQGNLWTEYIANTAKVEYMIFPRMMALSEVLWSPKAKRDWKDFERRLPVLFRRLDMLGLNYSNAYYDLSYNIMPAPDYNGVLLKLESRDKNAAIRYMDDELKVQMNLPQKNEKGDTVNVLSDIYWGMGKNYKAPIRIQTNNTIYAETYRGKEQLSNTVKLEFLFNKATGKKISLVNPPHKSYPGDGAFTLVNGIQNTKGLAKSSEFLGFLGTDLDATIDLGEITNVSEIDLHTFVQRGSWIYPPAQNGIIVKISTDGINFSMPPDEIGTIEASNGVYKTWFSFSHAPLPARYVQVIARNFGMIPSGNPGAGNPAWLFVDEIEVK
ncbi:MAG: beta-N-acetylhexosaminidase [Ferruginibacter sp.]